MNQSNQFLLDAEKKAFDIKHRNTINFNIGKYDTNVQKGLMQYEDHDLARSRAAFVKTQCLEHLDKYLVQFEDLFRKRGGKVIWARDVKEAQKAITKIIKEKNAKTVVKSKSMTTEEIHLNEHLESLNVEAIETDLGEFIVQLAGQKPYHIVTPAMHLSRFDVADIFEEKLHLPRTEDPQEMTGIARNLLRQKYVKADIGITGANFLIADIGGISITENEGNARLSISFPKTHIVIAGIEKMIPSIHDLSLFLPLLATSGTGQRLTVYNSIISGPRQDDETDGPEEMYVIMLDNGRTKLLADPKKRQALNCIRCGACLNACPVYKNIGGHTYNSTYSGPIGSVISPHLEGMKYKHLSYASSLCGACATVCPVRIDIPNLLLLNRRDSIKKGYNTFTERLAFTFWKDSMLHRHWMNFFGAKLKNFGLKFLFKRTWGKRRSFPQITTQSFQQLWKQRLKNR